MSELNNVCNKCFEANKIFRELENQKTWIMSLTSHILSKENIFPREKLIEHINYLYDSGRFINE